MTCQFCGTINPEFQIYCIECDKSLYDHPDNYPIHKESRIALILAKPLESPIVEFLIKLLGPILIILVVLISVTKLIPPLSTIAREITTSDIQASINTVTPHEWFLLGVCLTVISLTLFLYRGRIQ